MSTAARPALVSMSRRIASVQGSAPKMPTFSELAAGSRPWRFISSTITCM